jgi:hypothetical protein
LGVITPGGTGSFGEGGDAGCTYSSYYFLESEYITVMFLAEYAYIFAHIFCIGSIWFEFFIYGFNYGDISSAEVNSIELVNGFYGFYHCSHFHETETTGFTGLPVDGDMDIDYFPAGGE